VSTTAAGTVQAAPVAATTRRRSFALVFACTLINAAAQVCFKTAARQLATLDLLAVLTNVPLLAGGSLLGLSTIALVYALRDGELSLLYPVIALTYVWVAALSHWLFREQIGFYKLVGITSILMGVAVLGRRSR
jgi:drug/metabolite transporter (DMT)-like permease